MDQLILCENDFEVLLHYYSGSNSFLSLHNQERLLRELKDAKIVAKDNLPLNVVSTNSKVLIWNMTKGQTFTIRIVSDLELIGKENRISTSDPLSIALLGYSTGSITEWELEDGINRLQVLSVKQLNAEASNY
jgi:regulator of nucleoside diphosphate kinase